MFTHYYKLDEGLTSLTAERKYMGPEQKALWQITFKCGYRISNLYFHCVEDQIQFMFNQIARKDFMQPVELMSYELLGEIIDYEEYKPVKIN